jgi:hypothetical protein
METSCTFVAGAEWFDQAVVLGMLVLAYAFLASSRGQRLVRQLVNDEEAVESPASPAGAKPA